LSAQEAGLLADFLILAIKPEGDDKDYKLVEIGDTKVNAGLLGVVINTLPLDFLGLGSSERTYDEAAEISQCRAACRANTECRDFLYVRPTESQPVGVCHLKRATQSASFGVMTPVVSPGEGTIIEPPLREPGATASTQPQSDKVVFDDSEKAGRVSYGGDDVHATPLTLKFLAPVSNLKVFVRAANYSEGRMWANVDAFNAKGKRVGTTGTWISAGKFNFNQGLSVATEGDRIAVAKITARNGALIIDGLEFARTLITPPPLVAEAPEMTAPVTPPREDVPRPPRLPPITVEPAPLPPRVVAEIPTAPPRVITPEPTATPPSFPETPAIAPEPVATQPEPLPAEPVVATAPPPVVAPVERPRRGLPVWAVIAAVAFVLGGAATYRHSHRKRVLTRISTRLVSSGLDRHAVSVEGADRPDVSLRFVVRAAATVGAPATRIELIPAGATS
jgi:hypothetical protein